MMPRLAAILRSDLALLAAIVLAAIAPSRAQSPAIVPVPGLTVVSAAHDVTNGDYEGVSTITRITADESESTMSWTIPATKGQPARRVEATGVSRHSDGLTSRRIIMVHLAGDPSRYPGATAGKVSTAVLHDMRTPAGASIVLGTLGSDGDMLGALGGFLTGRKYYRGTVTPVESGTVAFPILLNDERVTVPAVHTRGRVSVGEDAGVTDFWVLDDDAYPIILKWTFRRDTVQIVSIVVPGAGAAKGATNTARIVQAMSKACHAELHGIYFDFASDAIKPQSEPALAALAAAIKELPAGTLTIEGHTDDIGSPQANLELSRKRAAAVKNALVTQYGVPASRIEIIGLGASHPVESNATLEGRARNRRVELARKC